MTRNTEMEMLGSFVTVHGRNWGQNSTLLCPQESGLSAWLGQKLTPLQDLPAPAIVFILCLLVATFTECTSNVATTTLFMPILASMVSEPRRRTSCRQPSGPPPPRDPTYGSQ